MGARGHTRERLHPAVYGTVLLMLVSVGRLPELVPALGVLQLGNVAALLGVAGVLVTRWRDDVPVFGLRTGQLIALYALLALFSVVISIWHTKSVEVLLNGLLTSLVMFFLIARSANSTRMLRIYAGALAASAALLATEAVLGYTAGRVQVGRAYDANDLAMVLVTILPLIVGGMLGRRGLGRWLLAAIAVIVLLTILLTGSRGGILGLIAVVGYLLFARLPRPTAHHKPRRLSLAKVAMVAGGGLLLVVAMPELTWERMASLANYESDYNVNSERGRLAVWERGLQAMAQRPWGHGIGTFEAAEARAGGVYQAAHNIWVETGVELGVLGVVLVFALFWTAVRTATRLSVWAFDQIDRQGGDAPPGTVQIATLAVATKGSLLGFLVTSFFLSVIYTGVIWALLGLVAALEYRERALADDGQTSGATDWRQGAARSAGRRGRGRPAYARGASTAKQRPRNGRI